jgi:deoxyribodipyrimidine photo-lyase
MNLKRLRTIHEGKKYQGPIVYWMQRDQRANDNWALLYAQEKAIEQKQPLYVLFNIVANFLDATIRQYDFMIKGLKEVETILAALNIPFVVTLGNPVEEIPQFIKKINASVLASDFNPIKIVKHWKKAIAEKIDIPFYEVDAHNIVPFNYVSNKQEYAAYTIRSKIEKLLPEFLDEFPGLKKMKSEIRLEKTDWDLIYKNLNINYDVKVIDWLKPGEKAAHNVLKHFIENKLAEYGTNRNIPTVDAQSNLSPYFHFGQIAPQRAALAVQPFVEHNESRKAFLEEMIIRRELADNFCYYNNNYDSFDGFNSWAKESLNLHRKDKRDYIYTLEELEHAETHDDLWNATQLEMLKNGKMHGYMRMYWAKKILEWTKAPEDAMRYAIYLNDKYELDGRDPNGYAGIAWSIGGVHDRPWFEREIFGKIRYMNYNGCTKKFDVKKYIAMNHE